MKMKLIITTLLLISLAGCYWNAPVIDLISPPKLTGEQIEIFNALTNSKGSALTLKYPKTGDYLSAFVFHQNTTAANRVMVFYELTGGAVLTEPTIWLTFLENNNGRWECTNDIAFFATDIERVDFAELGDKISENIIISYSILNQPDKSTCVISFDEDGVPVIVYERDFCVYYEIGDFCGSGSTRLLSINRMGEDTPRSVVSFIGWKEGEFVTEYSVDANPNANEYVRSLKSDVSPIHLSSVDSSRPALFLEYSQTENLFNTEIIVWDFGRIRPRNVIYTKNEARRREHLSLLSKRPNQFTAHAYARDIDGDGVINPAGNRSFPGYDNDEIPSIEKARAAIWYSLTLEDMLQELHYTFLSLKNDYVFIFPEDWIGNVTVTIDLENDEVIFWEYKKSYKSILDVEDKLFSINADYEIEIFDEALETEDLEELLILL
jgi:hypothetical protein